MFSQTLYSGFNGYRGLEMFLWKWIESLVGLLLLYFILLRLSSPLFAMLLVIFSPVEMVFNSYYQIILFPVLVLLWTLRKPSWFRYITFWFSVFIVFLLRYDQGITIIGSAFFIFIGLLIYYRRLYIKLLIYEKIIIPFISFFCVFGFFILIYILFILIKKYAFAEILNEWFYFFKIQSSSQSNPTFFSVLSPLVFWQYLFMPLILLSFIFYFLYNTFYRKFTFSSSHIILAFLAAFSLIISIRTVQRHSLLEGYSALFILFMISSSAFYFLNVGKKYAHIIFLTCIIIYYLIFSPIPTSDFFTIGDLTLIKEGSLFSFTTLDKKKNRADLLDNSQFSALNYFLKKNLNNKQTFFDFTNAPMLYVLTDRKFPSYIIPNLYHTSDEVQNFHIKKLESYLKAGDLPYVIFRQNTFWDAIDNVPQEIRSYRIAEFIYRNYQPCIMINNYEIWKQRDIKTPEFKKPIVLPIISAEHFNNFDIQSVSEKSGKVSLIAGNKDPLLFNFIDFGTGILLDSNKNYTLRFKYTSTVSGTMQFFYAFDGRENFIEKNSYRWLMNASGTEKELCLPITNPGKNITFLNLRFDPPNDAQITFQDIELFESDQIPITTPASQNFDLKLLPYIWGTYDEKKACKTSRILDKYTFQQMYLNPEKPLIIPIRSNIDKSSGNYLHFKIGCKESGKVTLTYGEKQPSTISFDLKPSNKFEDYLIRVSSQWAWNNESISKISLQSSVKIYIQSLLIRKGD